MIAKDLFTQFYDSFGITGVIIIITFISAGAGAITAYVIELADSQWN